MYRRPKFLEILIEIRQEMALEADYDVDLFAERVRGGMVPPDDTSQEPPDTERPPTRKKIKQKQPVT